MSLTLGFMAPFGRPTGGQANFEIPAQPAHLLYLHVLPQRVRGQVAGIVVADTLAARMLHETRMLPRWYLPRADVDLDLLEASDTVTHCPFKGDARYWNVRVGDRVIADAFWEYPEPLADAPPLAGLLAPDLAKLTSWWEEDEVMIGHPKDPFHRVDLRRSTRTVTVEVSRSVVASSSAPLAVDETGMPTRWYLPRSGIDDDLLGASDTSTVCPYKGHARYWNLRGPVGEVADGVWAYPEPVAGMERLAGYVCFAPGAEVVITVTPR